MEVGASQRKGLIGRSRSRLGRWTAKRVLSTVTRFTDSLVFYLEGQGDQGYETEAKARLWGKEPMEVRPHSYPGQPWHHIPECSNGRCVGGQHGSDKDMVVALSYLRDLLRGEAVGVGIREFDIGGTAARIARAHLARGNQTLPGLCDDPADPESREIFRQAWPWHLPYARQTGEVLLDEYFDEEMVYAHFLPTWQKANRGIPY